MKKFITQVLLFSIVFFAMEKMFYVFLYVAPSQEIDKRLEYVINGKLNKDLIVIGSSRGARNIIASQIEDSLNITSYNLSYPGSNIEWHQFVLKTLIKYNEKPKVVLLTVDDPTELLHSESINFRLDRLYPLSKYDYVNNELIERGEKSFLSKYFVLARINKSNFDVRRKHFTSLDTLTNSGSMPISFQKKNIDFVYNNNVIGYNINEELSEKINAFENLQEICTSNNIKLFLVFPPNFKKLNQPFANRLNSLSHPSVSSIFYDTTNKIYRDKNFYYDLGHLKNTGAIIFTNDIINQLKKDEEIINYISK